MRVAIIMGSMSDLAKVEPAITILKKFDIKVDVRCLSAHRSAKELELFIEEANNNGTEVLMSSRHISRETRFFLIRGIYSLRCNLR